MSQFVLGKYRFRNEQEYIAGKSDWDIIEEIRKKTDFTSFEQVKFLYQKISNGEIMFLSQIGRDFDDEIYELYEQLKKDSVNSKATGNRNHSNKVARFTKKQKSKCLEDFDEEMQNQILQEIKKRERVRTLVLIACVCVIMICVGYVIAYQFMTARTQRDVEVLAQKREEMLVTQDNIDYIPQTTESPFYHANITGSTQQNALPDILPLYEDLYNQNKSLIGWLKIADTIIDYPVMQSQDNEYYLDHNFNQQFDRNGSIFLDAECSIYPRSDNLILYGHHMKSGKMFGNLWKYEDKNYYLKHKQIEFDTIYETGIYEVMYVFRDKVYSKEDVNFKYYEFINAYSEEEFRSYMNEMASMSYYDTGVVAKYGDRLLTLSTCDYTQNNGRFVVVARKLD